jgi:hypothetical protein
MPVNLHEGMLVMQEHGTTILDILRRSSFRSTAPAEPNKLQFISGAFPLSLKMCTLRKSIFLVSFMGVNFIGKSAEMSVNCID